MGQLLTKHMGYTATMRMTVQAKRLEGSEPHRTPDTIMNECVWHPNAGTQQIYRVDMRVYYNPQATIPAGILHSCQHPWSPQATKGQHGRRYTMQTHSMMAATPPETISDAHKKTESQLHPP